LPFRHDFWADKKKPFIIGVTMTFVLLQLLFLANLSSLYAVEYKSTSKVHALKVLMVNFDTTGTTVQDSVLAAYSELRAESFNEVQVRTLAEYPTQQCERPCVKDSIGRPYAQTMGRLNDSMPLLLEATQQLHTVPPRLSPW